MSNFPNAQKVYDLAAVFREHVVEQGRSFLWPDQEIWTDTNAEGAMALLVSQISHQRIDPDEFHLSLTKADDQVLMLCADAVAAKYIPTTFGNSDTAIARLQAIIDSRQLPSPDPRIWKLWVEAIPATLGLPNHGWKGYYAQSIVGLINTIRAIQPSGGLSGLKQTELHDLLKEVEVDAPNYANWTAWELLSAMFPEEIPFVTDGEAKKIIRAFSNLGLQYEQHTKFDSLRAIRDFLAPEVPAQEFSFYFPSILEKWEKSSQKLKHATKAFNVQRATRKHQPDIEQDQKLNHFQHVNQSQLQPYQIASDYKRLVVDQRKSLLWPDEPLWSDDAIENFLVEFRDMPAEPGQKWLEVYEAQFANKDTESSRLLADSYAFLMQFPSPDSFSLGNKISTLNTILSWTPDQPADPSSLELVKDGFAVGIGASGTYFSAAIQYQLAYVAIFVRELRNAPKKGIREAANKAEEESKKTYSFRKSVVPSRNIILHLLEPNAYERIASQSDKIKIVESFGALIDELDIESENDIDDQLRLVRESLAGTYFSETFDFYDENVLPYWKQTPPPVWPPNAEYDPEPIAPTISDLAEKTFLDENFLTDIESLLHHRKQLIFEGPPGSGKTYVAEQFARYFTGQSLNDPDLHDQIELIQFHQSYSYEDFVEGIRPDTNADGQLVYNVVPGIFQEFAAKAAESPDKNFVLIIDEINRGNVSRILGELMLLLEYRDKSARLPYSKQPLQIPPNLYIIGTMNTADRSLSQIDYALRRRFYFVRFMSVENDEARVLEGWLQQQHLEPTVRADILHIFIELNNRLEHDLGTNDLQVGHSYFMHEHIHESRQQRHTWDYAVEPLIREYLYHHRDRDSLLRRYDLAALTRIPQEITEDERSEPVPDDTGEPNA